VANGAGASCLLRQQTTLQGLASHPKRTSHAVRGLAGTAKVRNPNGARDEKNVCKSGISAAAAGFALARAGHSDFKTTQAYIDLAGETFRLEAERRAEALGPGSTKFRYQVRTPSPKRQTDR
jgi:hypothetical protein